ncbi:hypothetical protein J9303_00515 [Bacillaceae bacterium Marseille-Q3522]|nr:hypothetical protein [Bacillaceae bacterium Marseille-Q3522]
MAIGFFIEYGGQVVQFPVNPEEIKINKDSNNETTEIVKLGEVTELGIPSLSETSFECFFPASKDYPFVLTKNKFWSPGQYIDFIEKIRRERRPCRFVVSDTKINILASVESFEYGHQWGDHEDVYYTLDLKEFREHAAKFVKIIQQVTQPNRPAVSTSNKQSASTNKPVTKGCRVIVNGRLHRDSYGGGPGRTEVNAERLVNFIKPGRSHPYHVTLLNGGWRGWVTASSVRVL